MDEQQEVVRLVSAAMYKLQYGPEFVDEFLDGFLLNRFGSNVLMTQFLALSDDKFGETGIIDPDHMRGGSVRPGGLPLPRATVPKNRAGGVRPGGLPPSG